MKDKTLLEKIEVMKAYANGAKIQRKSIASDNCWLDEPNPDWSWNMYEYRIRPESTYVPYKDTAEMIADYMERMNAITYSGGPLIWLKRDRTRETILITTFGEHGFGTDSSSFAYDHAFRDFTYLDGSPFGKEVDVSAE